MKLILLYFIIINFVGYIIMFIDKSRARRQAWRIPEARLWLISFIGGSLGTFLGMRNFHHKTKHKQFKYGLPFLAVLEIALLIYIIMVIKRWHV